VPPYVRRAKSLYAALPWLYLHGISTGDMHEALVGAQAAGLSAPVVARLKSRWSAEHQASRRSRAAVRPGGDRGKRARAEEVPCDRGWRSRIRLGLARGAPGAQAPGPGNPAAAGGYNYVLAIRPLRDEARKTGGIWVFYNNPHPFCYTYMIPGDWVAARKPNAYCSRDGRALADVQFWPPRDLEGMGGETRVERAKNFITQVHERL
jgi:hypothetical protein